MMRGRIGVPGETIHLQQITLPKLKKKFWNPKIPLGLGQSSVFGLMLQRQFALESFIICVN